MQSASPKPTPKSVCKTDSLTVGLHCMCVCMDSHEVTSERTRKRLQSESKQLPRATERKRRKALLFVLEPNVTENHRMSYNPQISFASCVHYADHWIELALAEQRSVRISSLVFAGTIFLICRRARRQRSQSPVLETLRIDKHFELYKKLSTKRKTQEFPISLSSDEANEQIPFDSPISKKERGKLYNPATQGRPSHTIVRTCKWRIDIELRQICTCRRSLNCKQPQW